MRWHLLVAESKRDGSGGVPREHVLVDLGMMEETVLNPNRVPGQLAREYRNGLRSVIFQTSIPRCQKPPHE
jgi:hypothetical protein